MGLQRKRQSNYALLLERLTSFVRSPKTEVDELTDAARRRGSFYSPFRDATLPWLEPAG
jgi:hypothetical protein